MERRVQLRNSSFCLIVSVLFAGCFFAEQSDMPESGNVFIAANDTSISQFADKILFRKELLNGTIYGLYDSGDTAFIYNYAHGTQNGWQQKWFEGHKPAEIRFYDDGKKEGTHIGWWENGNRKFEYHFSNDEHEGEANEWFIDGTKSKSFHYAAGHENGNQRLWWPDGSVRANYDVKNGKRYGLIGEKLCRNTIADEKN